MIYGRMREKVMRAGPSSHFSLPEEREREVSGACLIASLSLQSRKMESIPRVPLLAVL